jgi:serine/threonine-protein kinase
MLTGQKPFPRDSTTAVAMAHLVDPPPAPTSLNPRLGEAFDGVLSKALAKQPDDRYQTALALGDAAVAAAAGTDWDKIQKSVDKPATEDPRTDETQIIPRAAREPPGSEGATRILPGPIRQPSPRPAAPRAPRPRRRIRWLAIAVIALLVLIIVIAVFATKGNGGGKSATVAGDTNIRSSPEVPANNPEANVVGTFSSSQRVKVSCWTAGSGTSDGWVRLRSPDAGRYVSAALLTPVIKSPVC